MTTNIKPTSLEFTRLPDPALHAFGVEVHTRMTDNPNFTNLEPTLDTVKAAITGFQVAMVAAAAGGPVQTSLKNDSRKALLLVLRSWATLVGAQARGDLSKVLSSGFKIHKTPTPAGPLPAPAKVVLKATPFPGQVALRAEPVPNSSGYQIQSAAEREPTDAWTDHGTFTSSRVTLDSFIPGSLRWLRVRAMGAAGMGAWSGPVSVRVG